MRVKGSRRNKPEVVAHLKELFASAGGVLLTNYRGMTVAEITGLRKKLREFGCEYHVAKNTLVARALGDAASQMSHLLTGPTAIAVLHDDIGGPTKAMLDYFRDLRKPDVTIKGAWFGGRVYDAEGVVALSKLPPKPVIQGQVAGTLQAPLTNFVGVLNGALSEFVRTLQALADKQQAAVA